MSENPTFPGKPEAGVFLLVPAGGRGLRMGGGIPKQFRPWGGEPLLRATLRAFLAPGMPPLRAMALAVPGDRLEEVQAWDLGVPILATEGGDTRQASVAAALSLLPDTPDVPVLIHDGVRPFPPPGPIQEALASLDTWDGAVLAEPSTDTLKQVDAEGRILGTLDRSMVYRAQTPQIARLGPWREAMASAQRAGVEATDDVALLERMGWRVRVVPSPSSNLKLTTAEDWARLEPRG